MNRKITMIWETGDGQMIDLTRDVPPAAKAMTDNELNALIAEKVMGRENVRDLGGRIVYDSPVMFNAKTGKISFAPTEVPDYANDIAAAWQVALKVGSMPGYTVTIHVGDEVWIEKAVETDNGNDHLVTWQEVARVGTAEGDARAICLAALEAVGAI